MLALAPGVTVAIGHDDQAVAVGDTDLLNYLLLNLVDNALVRLPGRGGVALSLSVADGQTYPVQARYVLWQRARGARAHRRALRPPRPDAARRGPPGQRALQRALAAAR